MGWIEWAGKIVRLTETFSRKAVDDSFQHNAKNASGAGLEVRVSREYDGVGIHDGKDICQWCLDRCGENMTLQEAYAKGAFQRHEGCGCVIEYTSNKGVRTIQTGKYSGWNFDDELEKRKSIGLDEGFFAEELASRIDAYLDYIPEELYREAKAGNFYSKAYAQEDKKTKPELERSIKRYIRQVEEHEWKIQHPENEMTKFDPNDPIERARAIDIWKNHRRRNARYAKIALEMWREKYG